MSLSIRRKARINTTVKVMTNLKRSQPKTRKEKPLAIPAIKQPLSPTKTTFLLKSQQS